MSEFINSSALFDESSQWHVELKHAFRSAKDLLAYLEIPFDSVKLSIDPSFPLLVPKSFADRMKKKDSTDPLLKQVLNSRLEDQFVEGYNDNPLEESNYTPLPGVLHKYQGRALLIVQTACAVNCRYCFRRNFSYVDHRINWLKNTEVFEYLAEDTTIEEVLLSGGDPLLLDDKVLTELMKKLVKIPHIKRIRLHTRVPIVIPSRLTKQLVNALTLDEKKKTILVLHINHPNELENNALLKHFQKIYQRGVILLNQGVLLKGVNDNAPVLARLSDKYNK